MGNQATNFINCGLNEKDTKQQIISTREEAIKTIKGETNYRNQQSQEKGQNKVGSSPLDQNLYASETKTFFGKNNQNQSTTKQGLIKKNQLPYFPEHQNLIKLTKGQKNGYTKLAGSDYYEEEKGQCLDQIIERRYNTIMHFPEHQIRGLLQSMVYALAYMSVKEINHHDFYPTNIYYNNGAFKILNPLLAKYSGYSITQQSNHIDSLGKRFSFLSPQLILQILNDTSQLDIRKDVMDKSDVFSLGMIMLEFSTLQPSSQCYDSETYNIIDLQIQKRLEKTTQLYNPLIADCIDLMLQYEVEKRISPIELAYAVHSRTRQLKIEQMSQKSRLNYQQINDARVSMSKKVPQQQPTQLYGPVMSQPPPFFGNSPPPFIYALPPNMPFPQTVPSIPSQMPNSFLQPQIRSVGMIKPQNKSNDLPVPFETSSLAKPNSSLTTSTLSSPSLSDGNLIQPSSTFSSDPLQFKKSPYLGTEFKASQTTKNSYYSNPSSSLAKPQSLTSTTSQKLGQLNSKKKLNPFEQIQEEALKQDEDEQKVQYTPSQANKTNKKQQIAKYQSPLLTNYSSKLNSYTFKTVPKPSSDYLTTDYSKYKSPGKTTTPATTTTNTYLGLDKKKQQFPKSTYLADKKKQQFTINSYLTSDKKKQQFPTSTYLADKKRQQFTLNTYVTSQRKKQQFTTNTYISSDKKKQQYTTNKYLSTDKKKQQSLDQRVRKVLEMTKNLK